MSEAYLLLNVNFKKQNDVIEKIDQLSTTVKSVKTVYGVHDIWLFWNLKTYKK